MTKREFNAALKRLTVKKKGKPDRLCVVKAAALDDDMKDAMALHIIRNRGPVLVQLLTGRLDQRWLGAMAYYCRTKGESGYEFLHTPEHRIR